MTNDEFWDFYCEEGTAEDKYDEIFEFFSKELDDDFIENFDYDEVIYSTVIELFDNNKFEKAIDFIYLLESKQPVIYKNNRDELTSYLIYYYSYLNDEENIDFVFSKYKNNRIIYPYLYEMSFEKLIFYQQYIVLLKQITEKNYEEIVELKDKEERESFVTRLYLFNIFLSIQVAFSHCGNNKKIILKELNLYSNDLYKESQNKFYLRIVNELVKEKPSKEDLLKDYFKSKGKFFTRLMIQFCKYMNEKQVGFPLSWYIWGYVRNLWTIKKDINDVELIFKISLKRFKFQLQKWENIDELGNDKYFLVLWGGVYIYDFLKSIDMISEETHNHFINMTKELKGIAIYKYIKYLWNFSFIHSWERPDSISEEEFIAENSIFDKTFDNCINDFQTGKKLFEKELQILGEITDSILSYEKIDIEQKKKEKEKKKSLEKKNQLIKLIREEKNRLQTGFYDEDDENNEIQKPVKVEVKVGRNDPCPCGSGKKYKKCCMNK